MQLSTSHHNLVDSTATIFRLLVVALAAVAFVLEAKPIEQLLMPVGATYVFATGVLWLYVPRLTWTLTWLTYPIALIDVLAVTAIVGLSPAMALPLWCLYLFPLAITASSGRAPAIAAAGLSITAFLGVTWLNNATVSYLAIWQIAMLIAVTALVTVLSHRWMVERQEKRAWQEMAAAARRLGGGAEPDDVAATVAERARLLVRATRAWVWWCDRDGPLRLGAQAGRRSESLLASVELTPTLMHKLDSRSVSLDELGGPFAGLAGDVLLLRDEKRRLALLAVCWSKSPWDRPMRRQRLRMFSPWAVDALAKAKARATEHEKLRRCGVLAQAAKDLAGTLDRQASWEIIAGAAHDGLKTAVSIMERSSGRVLAGDVGAAETHVRLRSDDGEARVEVNVPDLMDWQPDDPFTASLEENVTMVAWFIDPKHDLPDTAWLDQLAGVGRIALQRCVEHEQLQIEASRLRGSLDALAAPLAIHDAEGTLLFANDGYLALGLDNVLRSGQAPAMECEEELAIGNPPRVFMTVTAPVLEGQYTISHYREITREREALRAKDELIAMIGHELRSPLTSIYGYSQLMARQLGTVQQQVDRLNHLIGDFVEAATLQGGQLPLVREPLNPVELAHLAAERFDGAYQGRSLRLELSDTPPLEGDPVRLGQVLDNLLGNAVKYSPADHEIVLGVGMDAGQIVLSVQDHGVGIAREHLPYLFDRFYRAPDMATDRVRGSGLGLSIVHDIVKAHGGRVWAESPGQGLGSTFRVSLVPLCDRS